MHSILRLENEKAKGPYSSWDEGVCSGVLGVKKEGEYEEDLGWLGEGFANTKRTKSIRVQGRSG